ncbi:SEC-C metal-binding domain-containing protein, partial [Myceligenerans cantabricum]
PPGAAPATGPAGPARTTADAAAVPGASGMTNVMPAVGRDEQVPPRGGRLGTGQPEPTETQQLPVLQARGLEAPRRTPLTYSAPSDDGSGSAFVQGPGTRRGRRAAGGATGQASSGTADTRTFPGTPRNAQCPCGSGKKYKACHGLNDT